MFNFNLKEKIEDKVTEVKEDIKDNLDVAIIGATGAVILSFAIGHFVGGRRTNNSMINVNITPPASNPVHNIIVNNIPTSK